MVKRSHALALAAPLLALGVSVAHGASLAGCAEPALAQRAAPSIAVASPRGVPLGDAPSALAAPPIDPRLVDTYPSYPPPPSAYPLDDAGNPIFGLDAPIEDPSGTALRALHAALRRAERGEGQARIVVYGASHVASDTWTAMTRRVLQERFGDAGHGFVLPAPPWRTYRHEGVTVESPRRAWEARRFRQGQSGPERFGLAGVAVETTASTWGRVSNQRDASRFELFYEAQPEGGSFDVVIDGATVTRIPTAAATNGAGYRLFEVADGPHTFEVRPRGNGPVKLYGVAIERERPGVVLDALGINGARASAQLQWDEALFQEHLRRRIPDLVVLAYGTNESGDDEQPIASYEAQLRQVVERVQRTVPTASCMLVGPSDRPIVARDGTASPRARTLDVIAVQRRVARDYGCGFFDLVAFGGGPMHMMQWTDATPPWALRDHVHYTRRAYDRLGQVIANDLLAGY